jgi:hypothetical protein
MNGAPAISVLVHVWATRLKEFEWENDREIKTRSADCQIIDDAREGLAYVSCEAQRGCADAADFAFAAEVL